MSEENLCPNGCGKMVTARHKGVEFYTFDEDGNEVEITITIYATWCPECKYSYIM